MMHPMLFFFSPYSWGIWPAMVWAAMLDPTPRRIVWRAAGNVIHVEFHHRRGDA